MQIASTSNLLSSIGQAILPTSGVSGVKTNSPLKNAKSETQEAAAEGHQVPAQASQASTSGKRGGLVNLVV